MFAKLASFELHLTRRPDQHNLTVIFRHRHHFTLDWSNKGEPAGALRAKRGYNSKTRPDINGNKVYICGAVQLAYSRQPGGSRQAADELWSTGDLFARLYLSLCSCFLFSSLSSIGAARIIRVLVLALPAGPCAPSRCGPTGPTPGAGSSTA